jgi:polyhydroxyalkanoate synthase
MAVLNPAEVAAQLRRDLGRSVLRVRNGIRHMANPNRSEVTVTPKDTVWRSGKAQLWRYRGEARRRVPVLLVHSLVSRSYVFDLHPKLGLVASLLAEDLDVFHLDWGVPDELDAHHTLETYVEDLIPAAIQATLAESGAEQVMLVGYCLGGILVSLSVAAQPSLPVGGIVGLATPVDFEQGGGLFDAFSAGRIRASDLIDDRGLVPASIFVNAFRLMKPTGDLANYARLWQNLWNDEFVATHLPIHRWLNDQIPFPGQAFVQFAEDIVGTNALLGDGVLLSGRRVRLDSISRPFVSLAGESDELVPLPCARGIVDAVPGAELMVLPGGHFALAAGRHVASHTVPAIAEMVARLDKETA